MRLGIDTGGTFTDFVLMEGGNGEPLCLLTLKVLSTPEAPERAIMTGIRELGLLDAVQSGRVQIIHGSTVATNAALEGKGVTTAYITNRGFADVLTIARQTRPRLYALHQHARQVPVPQEFCLETGGRIGADGTLLEPLTEEDLETLTASVEALRPRAVAINLLFSFEEDAAERRIENWLKSNLQACRPFISRSSAVLREYREYERGIATWLNASLGPLMDRYLRQLQQDTAPSPLSIMQSSGGTIDAGHASSHAVNLLLSGPAGGLAAISWLAGITGENRLMTFDMGGTSTDVALFDGRIGLTTEGSIGPWPVAVPMVDMHTIGAGGGSLAWIDSGGVLQVGPQSAGASPGPACYGQGGTQATVTDANLVLGRLGSSPALGGKLQLDLQLSIQALKDFSDKSGLTYIDLANGIIRIANEHMAQALRVISVARGYDPREFCLCCFGGAGGLHVCALADELGMNRALVPVQGGVLSALGMLVAPASRQYSVALHTTLDGVEEQEVTARFREMEDMGHRELATEGCPADTITSQFSADLRYRGQTSTLNIPWENPLQAAEAFSRQHESRFHHRLDLPVELVNLRVSVESHVQPDNLPLWPEPAAVPDPEMTSLHGLEKPVAVFCRSNLRSGQQIAGPALVTEDNACTLIPGHWRAEVDRFGNLRLEKSP
jgi:N-methylhydantoinase A